jgi:predicted flavoprotein YhiN
MGGVETSNSFQVLKTNGTIPNLYAVGSTTVADFPGHAGGANLACGGYSARKAADHIIELLK